jgi:hypothetical protein
MTPRVADFEGQTNFRLTLSTHMVDVSKLEATLSAFLVLYSTERRRQHPLDNASLVSQTSRSAQL